MNHLKNRVLNVNINYTSVNNNESLRNKQKVEIYYKT